MCNNKDHFKPYLRDRWAQHAHILWQDVHGARYAARLRCVLSSNGSLSCKGHRDSLKQVPKWWPNPSSQSTTHLSESFPAILVNPCNLSLFDCRTCNPTQSKSIHHYYILLHIIKIIPILTHLLALVCQILSTRAASSLPVITCLILGRVAHLNATNWHQLTSTSSSWQLSQL